MDLKFIDDYSQQLVLFDMDGVLAEYTAGEEKFILNEVAGVYFNKRPLMSIIAVAENLHNKGNVTIGILSSCEYHSQLKEKKDWLMKYIPFIDSSNIYIIVWSDEKYTSDTRKFAKLDKIKEMKGYDKIFLIEDTHTVIKTINDEMPGVAHHISELIN